MKPQSRRRMTPARFLDVKKNEPEIRLRPVCRRLEQQRFLLALKKQTKLNAELDLLALQKTVPRLSLPQIQNVIKFLKQCVANRVYRQVQKQRCEGKKNKVPVEIWAELAQKMAGVHMETISSAFSQMLVIAATEPCTLSYSNPPHITESQSTLASSLHTILMSPAPKSHSGSPPLKVVLPEGGCDTPQTQDMAEALKHSVKAISFISPSANAEDERNELLQNETGNDPLLLSTSATHEAPLSQSISNPTPTVSDSRGVSTAVPSLPPDTLQNVEPPECSQSEEYRPNRMSPVDFKKIYQFISNIVLKKPSQPLTAMESAVLLDLLMSLPEELPLLHCKELQHHFLQVHARLNEPAMVNLASTTESEQQTSIDSQIGNRPDASLQPQTVHATRAKVVQAGQLNEQETAIKSMTSGGFAGQSSAVYDRGDWVVAGLCPLNPFMVPVALLKRQ